MSEFLGTPQYRVVRQIGAGGMGIVYEAEDRRRGARVALKTLRNVDAQAVYRLKQEFRALQDIEHPNLVSLGELVEVDGTWFFTMELIEGVDFLSWVRPGSGGDRVGLAKTQQSDGVLAGEPAPSADAGGALDEPRLRAALAQLAAGLSALHGAGMIHRDIKPSNILVDASGHISLLDFGLIADHASAFRSADHQVVGTAAYMAPEQAASRPVGAAADWYSVGVILYEALTGRLPFSGPPLQIFMDKQQHEPPPPRARAPDVPPDLDALCAELLRFDPAARPGERSILQRVAADAPVATRAITTSRASDAVPFVGRDAQLRFLQSAFERTRRGTAATVFVYGESGVGKSALIQNFCERTLAATGAEAVVLAGRCYERETVPYKAFDGVIDALSRFMARLPPGEADALLPRHASLLPRVFPVLGAVEAIARAPRPRNETLDPHELRARVFGALRELFGRLAERRPLVVCIDDLQWADADSALLLEELMQAPEEPSLLLLISCRTASRDGTPPAEPSIAGDVGRIDLRPLAPDEARSLARRLIGRAELTGASASSIATEARGHPLYIAELVRHASAEDAGEAVRLDEAIWRRVQLLPPDVREVLRLVALGDAPLPPEVIRVASRLEAVQFAKHTALLRVAHLVKSSRGRGAEMIECYHDRVRESVVEHLNDDQRVDLHGRIAFALQAAGVGPDRPELLLRHLEGAGETEKAAAHAEEAAHRAVAALAFDRAAALYRSALRLGAHGRAAQRALQIALADALASAGQGIDAADLYLTSADGADPHDRLECKRKAAEALLKSGHIPRGMEVLSEVFDEVGASFPRTPGAAVRSIVWHRLRLSLRRYRWKPRHMSEVAPQQLARVDVYRGAARGLSLVDSVRGADFQSRATLRALQLGEPTRALEALMWEAAFIASPGGRGIDKARALLDRVEPAVAERDEPLLTGTLRGMRGLLAFDVGAFREAEHKFREAEQVLREGTAGTTWEIDAIRLMQSWCLRYVGEYRELAGRYARFVREAEQRGNLFVATTLRRAFAIVPLTRDDVPAARAATREPWTTVAGRFDMQDWYAVYGRGEVALYDGTVASERAELEEGIERLMRTLLAKVVSGVRIEAFTLRGRLAVACGDTAVAQRQARRLAKEAPSFAEHRGLLLRAGCAMVDGDRDGAAALLAESIERGRAIDLPAHVAAAEHCLGSLAGDPQLVAGAEAWLLGQRVARPARFVRMLLPGFA